MENANPGKFEIEVDGNTMAKIDAIAASRGVTRRVALRQMLAPFFAAGVPTPVKHNTATRKAKTAGRG